MRNFSTIQTQPYVGTIQPFNSKLCLPNALPPRLVPIKIDWSLYGASSTNPNRGVTVNLGTDMQDRLGKIGSVYIDNTASITPIYVQFPDTGMVITAAPNTAVWYPVVTNTFQFVVYGVGFVTGSIPLTGILVCNKEMTPSVDQELFNVYPQWRGSPTIQRANLLTPGFAAPALGDQIQTKTLSSALGQTVTLWNSPYVSGFIYLTNVQVNCYGYQHAGGIIAQTIQFVGSVSGVLFNCTVEFLTTIESLANVCNMSGMNVRLDATETWRANNISGTAGDSGIWEIITCWTQAPQ